MGAQTQPDSRVPILDFPGLVTHADRHDLQSGMAVDQVNLMSNRQSMLQVRPGLKPVTFEEE